MTLGVIVVVLAAFLIVLVFIAKIAAGWLLIIPILVILTLMLVSPYAYRGRRGRV